MIPSASTDPDWRLCVTGALAASVVGLLVLWLPPAWWIVESSYDMGFWLRPSPGIDTRGVLLVYMDEQSHSALGQLRNAGWSRGLHARLIDRLTDAGARAVVFDCLMQQTTNTVEDMQLVEAARRNGKVVVASLMTPEVHEGRMMGFRLQRPFEALQAVASSGPVEEAEDERLPRRHYANYQYREPGLAWRAAEKAGTGRLPADPMFERWINYYGPPGTFDSISYVEALRTDASITAQLSNRVVFVGANYSAGFAGGNLSDTFRTPYTAITRRKSTGVEVIATTCLNLVRGDWLRRLSPLAETLLVAVCGTSLGLWLLRLHPVRMAVWAAVVALGICAVSVITCWSTRYWLPWSVPVFAQIPLLLAAGLVIHSYRTSRERFALERSLAMLANVLTPESGTGTVLQSGGSPSSDGRIQTLPLTPTSADQPLPDRPVPAGHEGTPPRRSRITPCSAGSARERSARCGWPGTRSARTTRSRSSTASPSAGRPRWNGSSTASAASRRSRGPTRASCTSSTSAAMTPRATSTASWSWGMTWWTARRSSRPPTLPGLFPGC